MLRREEILLIIYFILVILFLTGFTIIFFITYQRRKNKLLQDKFEAEQRFIGELNSARIEIQEATLKNISWELHDNIGQLLSIASIQLNILAKKSSADFNTEILEVKGLVKDSLSEVRSLSRSLNNEVIDHSGLEKSVRNEIDRFNRMEILQASLEVSGNPLEIKPEDAIILFRILQEFFSNVIKYAEASSLKVKFQYSEKELIIEAKDDGKGYEISEIEAGSGLINMRSRAELIKANFEIQSAKNSGTSLSLKYPTKKTSHE